MSAPVISLGGLYPDSDENEEFTEIYETSKVNVCDIDLQIRQYSFHSHNANQIWPGTYALAEYIKFNILNFHNKNVLELGAATGVLSIYLNKLLGIENVMVITSDIADEGLVEDNVKYNYQINGLECINHIPHTWGTIWDDSRVFDIVIASDILLYVSAYPALVKTLKFLFTERRVTSFIMSWKRRIAESSIFFEQMEAEGFALTKFEGDASVYIFRYDNTL